MTVSVLTASALVQWLKQKPLSTRVGDGRLRSKLIQAAWSAIGQDAELREFYRSVAGETPAAKAPASPLWQWREN
jgi:hypothetical protein